MRSGKILALCLVLQVVPQQAPLQVQRVLCSSSGQYEVGKSPTRPHKGPQPSKAVQEDEMISNKAKDSGGRTC
ncbi:hypothetical protein O3P69_016232 [Scylla paramamosain]|uniref:Secreted protein n=1 Tax=Scylla paramamosain TaxID=85552 RepID=A0AAW0SAH6_SCYPA